MTAEDGPSVSVRRFRSGDGAAVRELHEVAMAGTPEYVPDAPDEDLHDVPGHYLDGGGELLVATTAGSVVGMGAYATPGEWKGEYVDLTGDTAELTRMRVDPAWQGRGVGTAIFRELERRGRAAGYRRFVLDTGVDNDTARGFYEGLGFECLREVAVDFRDLTIELALYEKSLDDSTSR